MLVILHESQLAHGTTVLYPKIFLNDLYRARSNENFVVHLEMHYRYEYLKNVIDSKGGGMGFKSLKLTH